MLAFAIVVVVNAAAWIGQYIHHKPEVTPALADSGWQVTFSETNEFGQLSEIKKYRSSKVHGEMWLLDGKPYKVSFFIDPNQ